MKHLILAAALVAVPLAASAQMLVVAQDTLGDRVLLNPAEVKLIPAGSAFLLSATFTWASDGANIVVVTPSPTCVAGGGYMTIGSPVFGITKHHWLHDGDRIYDAFGRALCRHAEAQLRSQKTKS